VAKNADKPALRPLGEEAPDVAPLYLPALRRRAGAAELVEDHRRPEPPRREPPRLARHRLAVDRTPGEDVAGEHHDVRAALVPRHERPGLAVGQVDAPLPLPAAGVLGVVDHVHQVERRRRLGDELAERVGLAAPGDANRAHPHAPA
jgi:hypothetical protein